MSYDPNDPDISSSDRWHIQLKEFRENPKRGLLRLTKFIAQVFAALIVIFLVIGGLMYFLSDEENDAVETKTTTASKSDSSPSSNATLRPEPTSIALEEKSKPAAPKTEQLAVQASFTNDNIEQMFAEAAGRQKKFIGSSVKVLGRITTIYPKDGDETQFIIDTDFSSDINCSSRLCLNVGISGSLTKDEGEYVWVVGQLNRYFTAQFALGGELGMAAIWADEVITYSAGTLLTEPEINVSVTELSDAYGSNPISADRRYKGKVASITGTINLIGQIPHTKVYFGGLDCVPFDDRWVEQVSTGQQITVIGKISGDDAGTVRVIDCFKASP